MALLEENHASVFAHLVMSNRRLGNGPPFFEPESLSLSISMLKLYFVIGEANINSRNSHLCVDKLLAKGDLASKYVMSKFPKIQDIKGNKHHNR